MSVEYENFYFLPLGGSGEIGMNLNLYCYKDNWLMVDLGVTFNDTLGVDIIMPNPQFIVERREKLCGLLLTHAHEDHIGAVAYLWPQLRCPIYTTPFTAIILRAKLEEAGLLDDVKIHEIPVSGSAKIGPFELDMIRLTHSIPEPNGVLIKTPLGKVFHTGDWKLDPEPMLGEPTDEEKLKAFGASDVLAMVCDSTNAFEEKNTGSEKDAHDGIQQAFADNKKGMVIVTCFASNVARLQSIAKLAAASGRKVALAGRSFGRMVDAAQQCGYLKDMPDFIPLKNVHDYAPKDVCVICTGSQGEGRAALWRIAEGTHPNVTMHEGDVVIFSSRVIPGNEKRIGLLKNRLIRLGVTLITQHQYDIHVSGHPSGEELRQMYQWIKPKVSIPVHGELRHMVQQGKIARQEGVAEVVIPENGTLIQLAPGPADIIDEVSSGRLALDGNAVIRWDHNVLKERAKLSHQGVIFITIFLDADWGLNRKPEVTLLGLVNLDNLREVIVLGVSDVVEEVAPIEEDIDLLKEEVEVVVRRICRTGLGKKPSVVVHIVQEMPAAD